MNDLNDLLDRAAGPLTATGDARPDLGRGRRALARTRTRRGAAGLAGIAAVGVLGTALTRVGEDPSSTPVATDPSGSASATPTLEPTPTATPTGNPTVDPSAPVTGSATPAFFSVPSTLAGWAIQGSSPYGVTFAPPGNTTAPEDFEGKVVVMFSRNPAAGKERTVDGRSFWVLDSGDGYARVTTENLDGPQGHLELQYPVSIGWTPEQAIAFLSGVRALDGAVATRG